MTTLVTGAAGFIGYHVSRALLARGTPGFSGADLANLVNEAALRAARRNKKKITMSEMDEAIERAIRKSSPLPRPDKGDIPRSIEIKYRPNDPL